MLKRLLLLTKLLEGNNMEHHFDIEDAKKYGIVEAVILHNIRFWIMKNKANNTHLHDGEYWTYNSVSAFTELFPYLTKDQIRRALESLENAGAIKTGNYNQSPYDRTKWYCIIPQIDLAKEDLPFGKNPKCITYINTDNKTDSVSQDETDHTPVVVEKKKRATKKSVELDMLIVKKFYYDEILLASNSSDIELASRYKAYVNYIFNDNVKKEPLKEMLSVKGQLTYEQYKDLVQLSSNSKKGIKQAIEVGENTPNYWKNKETIFLTLKNWMSK
jgi:hypothetical protein